MKQTLKNLIADGKTKQALDQLRQLHIADTDLNAEVVQVSARFAQYERQQRMGVEDPSVLGIELRKINSALLSVIDRLDSRSGNFKSLLCHKYIIPIIEDVNCNADAPCICEFIHKDIFTRRRNISNQSNLSAKVSDSKNDELPMLRQQPLLVRQMPQKLLIRGKIPLKGSYTTDFLKNHRQ
jgi:hypothetical protein